MIPGIVAAQGVAGGGGGANDPYWANVVSLLHLEGADGETTITDEKGHAWSVFGGAALSSASVPFGTTALNLIGSSSQYIETTDASLDFAYGTGDFTVELFARCTVSASYIGLLTPNTSDAVRQIVRNFGDYNWYASALRTTNGNAGINTWAHIALVRASGVVTLYAKGIPSGTTYNETKDYSTAGKLRVGGGGAFSFFTGQIKEVRVTKGVARYTSAFTPPTGPFPTS